MTRFQSAPEREALGNAEWVADVLARARFQSAPEREALGNVPLPCAGDSAGSFNPPQSARLWGMPPAHRLRDGSDVSIRPRARGSGESLQSLPVSIQTRVSIRPRARGSGESGIDTKDYVDGTVSIRPRARGSGECSCADKSTTSAKFQSAPEREALGNDMTFHSLFPPQCFNPPQSARLWGMRERLAMSQRELVSIRPRARGSGESAASSSEPASTSFQSAPEREALGNVGITDSPFKDCRFNPPQSARLWGIGGI